MLQHPDPDTVSGFMLGSLILACIRSDLSAQFCFDAVLEGQILLIQTYRLH